jgi:hypothetical protein
MKDKLHSLFFGLAMLAGLFQTQTLRATVTFANTVYSNGWFQFDVSGPNGNIYTIDTSTNLVDWAPLLLTNVISTPFEVSDSSASNSIARYYRAALGPEILDTTNQIIYASQGGTIMLGSGSSASIPAGFLTNDAVATLSLLSEPGYLSPNGIIGSRGNALFLDLMPIHAPPAKSAGIRSPVPFIPGPNVNITLYLAATSPSGAVPFTLLYPTSVQQAGSSQQSLFYSPQPQSNGTFVIQQAFLQALGFTRNSFSVIGFMADLNLPSCGNTAPQELLWNGSGWTNNLSSFDPSERTLVFVHGMMSSVESAFPDPVPIMQAGGYCQALGFDYDWTQGVNISGQELATFLNSFMAQMSSVDIEAHSEGVAVSLSAAGLTSMTIKNMVLLGGPIQGTPAANNGSSLVSLYGYLPVSTSLCAFGHSLADIENGQFVQDMAYHSQTMSNIVATFLSQNKSTRVVEVAGTSPTLLGTSTLSQFLIGSIFGSEVNDGIIPLTSAEGLPSASFAFPPATNAFNDNHIQLETDPRVIGFAGDRVADGNSITNLLGTWTGTWTGESQPSAVDDYTTWTTAVSGTWTLILQQYDPIAETASGTLKWQGTDAYWTYTVNDDPSTGAQYLTDVTSYSYPVNLTVQFANGLTSDGSGAGGWQTGCGVYRFGLENNAVTTPPYGLYFAVNLSTSSVVDGSTGGWDTSWDAQVFYPDGENAIGDGESGYSLEGSKQQP